MAIRYLSGINVDSNTLFVDDANNRVGIGTATPAYKLDVNGNARAGGMTLNAFATGTSGGNLELGFDGTQGVVQAYNRTTPDFIPLYLSGSDFRFNPNGTERMRITSAGNVGIGTTDPQDKLEIKSGFLRMYDPSSNINAGYTLQWSSDNGGSNVTYAGIDGITTSAGARTGDLRFLTSNAGGPTEKVRIKGNGNVLIGTTTDSGDRLRVDGGRFYLTNSVAYSAYIVQNLDTSASTFDETLFLMNSFQSDSAYSAIGMSTNGTDGQHHRVTLKAFRDGNIGGQLQIFLREAGTASNVSRVTFRSNGNVGIGTTEPLGPLEVYRSATGALGGHIIVNNNGTAVGNETALMFGDGAINGIRAAISSTTENSPYYGDIKFKTGASVYSSLTTQMMIKGGGNVLIGTTTDAGIKLDVNGTGRFSGGVLYLGNYSGNPELTLQATNNSWSKINFYDNNNTEGLYIRTDGASYGGTMTFGARWDDDEGKVFFKMFQSSAGAAYDVKIGVNTGSPESMLHLDKSSSSNNISDTPSIIISNKDSTSGTFIGGGIFNNAYRDVSSSSITAGIWFENQNSTGAGALAKQSAVIFGAQSYATGYNTPSERMRITADGNVGIGTTAPSQLLHVSGNIRVTGAYYDSNNEAGTSGQVLSSTGSGTDWITPATTTATSLYDLLPAARVAFNWTGQVVNDTWTTVFSKSSNLLTTGTWMVRMYVSDFATGGGHYTYTYSGMFTWYQDTTNQGGESAASEIYLHRMGHAANASVLYLRTTETAAASSGDGLFQIKGNYSNTSNQTISFQFVKIF